MRPAGAVRRIAPCRAQMLAATHASLLGHCWSTPVWRIHSWYSSWAARHAWMLTAAGGRPRALRAVRRNSADGLAAWPRRLADGSRRQARRAPRRRETNGRRAIDLHLIRLLLGLDCRVQSWCKAACLEPRRQDWRRPVVLGNRSVELICHASALRGSFVAQGLIRNGAFVEGRQALLVLMALLLGSAAKWVLPLMGADYGRCP